ncbi:MAG TPA: hypothetical protein VEL76_20390 [Gemmataceae bacterium]|nr:hypothetical protein [Gemmataceae bacterium]
MRSAIVLLLVATAAPAQMPEGEFFQDFRGKPTHLALQVFGYDVPRVVRNEPSGRLGRQANDRVHDGPAYCRLHNGPARRDDV